MNECQQMKCIWNIMKLKITVNERKKEKEERKKTLLQLSLKRHLNLDFSSEIVFNFQSYSVL